MDPFHSIIPEPIGKEEILPEDAKIREIPKKGEKEENVSTRTSSNCNNVEKRCSNEKSAVSSEKAESAMHAMGQDIEGK
ncbi:unnamed protein product [Caenorhabditis auriculariae]|uniref:Uncharacterized protein n=1 Tax=Caenorhabditis auriculariae TaxID=2777116 RepID=A0A8S1HUF4_9PELO|nr:unnamed protein product [Caenorhabditis auriculariae]